MQQQQQQLHPRFASPSDDEGLDADSVADHHQFLRPISSGDNEFVNSKKMPASCGINSLRRQQQQQIGKLPIEQSANERWDSDSSGSENGPPQIGVRQRLSSRTSCRTGCHQVQQEAGVMYDPSLELKESSEKQLGHQQQQQRQVRVYQNKLPRSLPRTQQQQQQQQQQQLQQLQAQDKDQFVSRSDQDTGTSCSETAAAPRSNLPRLKTQASCRAGCHQVQQEADFMYTAQSREVKASSRRQFRQHLQQQNNQLQFQRASKSQVDFLQHAEGDCQRRHQQKQQQQQQQQQQRVCKIPAENNQPIAARIKSDECLFEQQQQQQQQASFCSSFEPRSVILVLELVGCGSCKSCQCLDACKHSGSIQCQPARLPAAQQRQQQQQQQQQQQVIRASLPCGVVSTPLVPISQSGRRPREL